MILDREQIHHLLCTEWRGASEWIVGRYMVLPDHIHLFCAPGKIDHLPVKTWIKFWKSQVTKKWPYEGEKPIWQREAWDRQLRSGESYLEKWAYVRENSVRHGLVDSADAWPYQGELNRLRWHD